MLLFRKSLLMAACCLLVAGCASVGGEGSDSSAVSDDKTLLEGSYPAMAREMSGGSVQIYGLEGDVPSLSQSEPLSVSPADVGLVSGADSNVTVYPVASEGVKSLVPPPVEYDYASRPEGVPMRSSNSSVSLIDEMQPSSPYSVSSVGGGDARIYFRHGSSRLTAHDIETIRRAVSIQGGRIIVEGHASHKTGIADPVESSIVNLKMSMDRAFAVSSALIRSGVPLSSIETRAFGDGKSSDSIDGKDSESSGRRVDILTGQPVMAGY